MIFFSRNSLKGLGLPAKWTQSRLQFPPLTYRSRSIIVQWSSQRRYRSRDHFPPIILWFQHGFQNGDVFKDYNKEKASCFVEKNEANDAQVHFEFKYDVVSWNKAKFFALSIENIHYRLSFLNCLIQLYNKQQNVWYTAYEFSYSSGKNNTVLRTSTANEWTKMLS